MKFTSAILAFAASALLSLSAWAGFDSTQQTATIAAALKQYYGLEGTLELTAVTPLKMLEIKPTSVELVEVPTAPTSTMLIKARYLQDGVPAGEISGSFRAQWRVNVLVAKRQLSKGPLDLNDFEVQAADRLTLRQVPVSPQAELKGYEIISAVNAGATLTWNALKAQSMVRKGELVDVVAQDGNLKINTRAQALNDAGKGEAVLMRNLTTNRQFEAYVINENLVQIRF